MLNMGSHPLKMHNDIVTLIKTDDAGQLWFSCHKPRGVITQYEQSFPARLFFYQKGIEFYLEAKGVAFLANYEETMQCKNEMSDDTILVKMTPAYIEYTETKPKTAPIFSKWVSTLRNLFTPPVHFSK